MPRACCSAVAPRFPVLVDGDVRGAQREFAPAPVFPRGDDHLLEVDPARWGGGRFIAMPMSAAAKEKEREKRDETDPGFQGAEL